MVNRMPPALSQLTLHHHHMPKSSAACLHHVAKKKNEKLHLLMVVIIVEWPLLFCKRRSGVLFFSDRKGDQ
jgi:hypothetical protein